MDCVFDSFKEGEVLFMNKLNMEYVMFIKLIFENKLFNLGI